jgi:hypothetical protein
VKGAHLGVRRRLRLPNFSHRPEHKFPVGSKDMHPDEVKPTPPVTPKSKSADSDDDFNETLGERQPETNDAIVCEGGCQ